MKMIHIPIPDHPEATLEGYILDCEITLGQSVKRPAVVVCPGGGYVYCSPREGEPVALAYAAKGFHAFVLRYSTGWDAAGFAPLQEILAKYRALGYTGVNDDGRWNLTAKGYLISNTIISELLLAQDNSQPLNRFW